MIQGRNWEFVQRGLTFFSREAQHPLGLKNSLSTVDITDPGNPPPLCSYLPLFSLLENRGNSNHIDPVSSPSHICNGVYVRSK